MKNLLEKLEVIPSNPRGKVSLEQYVDWLFFRWFIHRDEGNGIASELW